MNRWLSIAWVASMLGVVVGAALAFVSIRGVFG
jgi:hypothetical protein